MKRRVILVGVVYLILLLTACQAGGISDPLSSEQVDADVVISKSLQSSLSKIVVNATKN